METASNFRQLFRGLAMEGRRDRNFSEVEYYPQIKKQN